MQSWFYLPNSMLQPFITGFIYSAVGEEHDDKFHELDLFPLGYSLMAFILKDTHYLFHEEHQRNYNVRFNFTGQLDKHHHLVTSSSSMIYVVFKPFGAYGIFGIPQHLFKNECLMMNEILGNATNDVFDEMLENAHSPEKVVLILQNWLCKMMNNNPKPEGKKIEIACSEIVKNSGNLPIRELYRHCGMSKSSLELHFKEHVGLSPKMYSRIIRFNEINRYLKTMADADWHEVVERYGYFDQSHFIREFKEFFGFSPSQKHLSYQNLSDHISSVNIH